MSVTTHLISCYGNPALFSSSTQLSMKNCIMNMPPSLPPTQVSIITTREVSFPSNHLNFQEYTWFLTKDTWLGYPALQRHTSMAQAQHHQDASHPTTVGTGQPDSSPVHFPGTCHQRAFWDGNSIWFTLFTSTVLTEERQKKKNLKRKDGNIHKLVLPIKIPFAEILPRYYLVKKYKKPQEQMCVLSPIHRALAHLHILKAFSNE